MTGQPHRRRGSEAFEAAIERRYDEEVRQVLRLSARLCALPTVTVPHGSARFSELGRAVTLVRQWASARGLRVIERPADEQNPYPYLVVALQQGGTAALLPPGCEAIALVGHLDVVPAGSDEQFAPSLVGDDLHARGAADMKTVVATYLVWLARLQAQPGPKPPLLLLLSCCEENGSHRPHHTRSVLQWLEQAHRVRVRFALVGERTGELEWMPPDLRVGPICKENRSWRWLRLQSQTARGIDALRAAASMVERGRTTIDQLNRSLQSQPDEPRRGRSGLVNAFVRVPADEGVAADEGSAWIEATRVAGSSVHSATASTSNRSVIELLADLVERAIVAFGGGRVLLVGVEIGEDGNFNTYDGSGALRLMVRRVPVAEVAQWAAQQSDQIEGVSLRVLAGPLAMTVAPTVVGLDIRELRDHRRAVDNLIASLDGGGELLDGRCEHVLDLPAWRCPADHPDLVQLEAAYRDIIGEPSPDLIKLHGNDGGHLAALQQARDPRARELGQASAVVFGQVGSQPHGPRESHRATSIRPYLDILDRWVRSLG